MKSGLIVLEAGLAQDQHSGTNKPAVVCCFGLHDDGELLLWSDESTSAGPHGVGMKLHKCSKHARASDPELTLHIPAAQT